MTIHYDPDVRDAARCRATGPLPLTLTADPALVTCADCEEVMEDGPRPGDPHAFVVLPFAYEPRFCGTCAIREDVHPAFDADDLPAFDDAHVPSIAFIGVDTDATFTATCSCGFATSTDTHEDARAALVAHRAAEQDAADRARGWHPAAAAVARRLLATD